MIFLIIFRYIPIFGNVIAFMDYNPYDTAASTWVGFDHFVDLLTRPQFLQVFGNTLYISILKMVCGFPIPIILALMMNEMKNMKFKKVSQTLLYLPNFISWVVLSGLIMNMLDPDTGLVTSIINSISGEKIQVLTDTRYFVPMLIVTDIYKGAGWGTIIYFAALSGIDPQLYEAAEIDGARKWKQLLHITLPSITPTIVVMLILSCNNIVNAGFDHALFCTGLQRGGYHRYLRLQNRYQERGLLVLHGGRPVQIRHRVRHDPDCQYRCQKDRQRRHLVRRE